jgi:hypothetical protein
MSRSIRDWRPLPEQVVVVAFPTARAQVAWPKDAPRPGSDFFLVQADGKDIFLPRTDIKWLKLLRITHLAAGLSRVDYHAADNTQGARRILVPVNVQKKSYMVTFLQQPGELVQTQLVRTLNCPLNIDCLIAIMFIADLIQKIPVPPIKIIVMAIAVLAIIVLGFAVIALRHSFTAVPEPKPLSTNTNGVPIILIPGVTLAQGLPFAGVAAEDQTIALQTIKEIYWLIKQVLQ